MPSFLRDFRYAVRVLAKTPSFTAATVCTLGLGLGGACAMFSLVDAVALRPFLLRNADRIVTVAETLPKAGSERMGVAAGNYCDWKNRSKTLREMAAYRPWNTRLGADENSQSITAYQVTPGFFQVLGTAPLRGRLLSSQADMHGQNDIVISFGFWRDGLGADPAAIGKGLLLNGARYTVVGVMPQEVDFPVSTQIWAPLLFSAADEHDRTRHDLSVIATLKDGVSPYQADEEVKNVAARLAEEYPATNAARSASVLSLRDSVNLYAREFAMVLLAAAALLLLLACTNAANLQVARALGRRMEMAVRVAIGAERGRILRQLAIEGLVLGLAAAILGTSVAFAALHALKAAAPAVVTRNVAGVFHADINSRVLLIAAALALATTVLSMLPAALQTSMSGSLTDFLKQGGRTRAASGRRPLRSVLVIGEVALATVLLMGAVSITKGFRALTHTESGYDSAGLIMTPVSLPDARYRDSSTVASFYRNALQKLAGMPGVRAVGLVDHIPSIGDSATSELVTDLPDGGLPDRRPVVEVRSISDGYFAAMHVPVYAGRNFTPHDNEQGAPVVIVSQSLARRLWPRSTPVGQRLRLASDGADTPWMTVVGIAGDVNFFFLEPRPRATIYLPYLQRSGRSAYLMLRTDIGAEQVLRQTSVNIRKGLHTLDPLLPVNDVRMFQSVLADLSGGVRLVAVLMIAFAVASLMLASAGIYALLSYAVAQRAHEISVRVAVGAAPCDVRRMIVGNAMRLVGIGLAAGTPVAWLLGRGISKILFGATPDTAALMACVATFSIVALMASALPAHRAVHTNVALGLR